MAGASKLTKPQFMAAMAEKSGLDKRQVNAAFDALQSVIKEQLGPDGPGELSILNLLKLKVKVTKGVAVGELVTNPFTKTKEPAKEAKPGTRKIKSTPMKGLKDLVNS